MNRENAVEVQGLGKAYRMYPSPARRIFEALSFGSFRGHHEFWALRDIDFALKPGGSLGLCGSNGAGKSTLLKVLAGTTAPSEGRYRMGGRVASLLELGAGFHPEFSGRANILINGILMGLTRREITAKVDEIIEFAELGDYIDEPVRTYSSGMGLRLGFACALAVDPDVMIIDEVFAVGDMYFQKKCVDKIYELKTNNKTILFCSHSLYDIRQLCDQAIWIRRGECASMGDSLTVTNDYSSFQRQHIDEARDHVSGQYPQYDGEEGQEMPQIVDARLYRLDTDEEVYSVETGDGIEIRIWWRNPDPERMPIHIAAGFLRQDMTTCAGMGTHLDGVQPTGPEGCTVLRIPKVTLLSGQFLVPVLIFDGGGMHKYHEYFLSDNLVVRTTDRQEGLIMIEHEWELQGQRPLPARPVPAHAGESRSEEGAA